MNRLISNFFSSHRLPDFLSRFRSERQSGARAHLAKLSYGVLVLALAALVTSQSALASVIVRVSQINNDVVFSASGTINYTDLTDQGDGLLFDGFDNGIEFVIGGTDGCSAPPSCDPGFDRVDIYGGNADVIPPDNLPFSTVDNFFQTDISDGGRLGVAPFGEGGYAISVPDGYNSGESYSGSSTFANETFASLGLVLGVYTWTWGTGDNADSLTLIIQAELIPVLNGQAVYDTYRNITWLADTNLAASEKFGVPIAQLGYMNQTKALEWLAAMNASDNGNGYLGFNAWRLTTVLDPDTTCTTDWAGMYPSTDSTGWNCTGSEFGHLFYEGLGGIARESILDSSDPDVALFSNFVLNNWYWTGTDYAYNPGSVYAFAWHTASGGNAGYQPAFVGGGSYVGYAWPVADGNPFGAIIPPLFNDVPLDYWSYSFIQALALSGITAGCGNNNYCPASPVSRAEMAVFLERGMHGRFYRPTAASGNVFVDVGAGDFAASFIEQLFSDGITAGCGNDNYCPNADVSRAQMAVFLLRAKYGADYSPPPATGVFNDVPLNYWAVHWIEQLAAEGITAGCGGGNYCPEAQVTRDQMAVFLVRTFGL